MRSKSILASAAVAAALIAAVGTTAASHDDEHGRKERRLKADLRGFGEVPAVSTAARGSLRAVLSEDESEITYRLDYAGLQGNVLQAHIHVGDHHTNGGISVWLCGNPSTTPPVNPPAGTPAVPAFGRRGRGLGDDRRHPRRRPGRAAHCAWRARRAGPCHQGRCHLRQRPHDAGPERGDPGPDPGRLSAQPRGAGDLPPPPPASSRKYTCQASRALSRSTGFKASSPVRPMDLSR